MVQHQQNMRGCFVFWAAVITQQIQDHVMSHCWSTHWSVYTRSSSSFFGFVISSLHLLTVRLPLTHGRVRWHQGELRFSYFHHFSVSRCSPTCRFLLLLSTLGCCSVTSLHTLRSCFFSFLANVEHFVCCLSSRDAFSLWPQHSHWQRLGGVSQQPHPPGYGSHSSWLLCISRNCSNYQMYMKIVSSEHWNIMWWQENDQIKLLWAPFVKDTPLNQPVENKFTCMSGRGTVFTELSVLLSSLKGTLYIICSHVVIGVLGVSPAPLCYQLDCLTLKTVLSCSMVSL